MKFKIIAWVIRLHIDDGSMGGGKPDVLMIGELEIVKWKL